MKTAKQGDRIRVHYVKRFPDGSVISSRGKRPLELTIGSDHPRLPGLGLALVGLAPGETTTVKVPPEQAYGHAKPNRIFRWSPKRFPEGATLSAGELVRVTNKRGRRRVVRVLEVQEKVVVIDANHRWAGQIMELKVRLQTICNPQSENAHEHSPD